MCDAERLDAVGEAVGAADGLALGDIDGDAVGAVEGLALGLIAA